MYMRTIPSLRIIVAMVIAFESVISWMPMYGEIKLSFFVYLWYPKTKVRKYICLSTFMTQIYVKLQESLRGCYVFLVQPTCPPANENLMELLVMIDACRRASAKNITAVIPYFGYAKADGSGASSHSSSGAGGGGGDEEGTDEGDGGEYDLFDVVATRGAGTGGYGDEERGDEEEEERDLFGSDNEEYVKTPTRSHYLVPGVVLIVLFLTRLHSLSFFVLDEADRMIERGHFHELQSIIEMLPLTNGSDEQAVRTTPSCDTVPILQIKKRQTFVFSATLALSANFRKKLKRGLSTSKTSVSDDVSSIEALSKQAGMKPNAEIVDLTKASILPEKLEESFIECSDDDKDAYLYCILSVHGQGRTIIFCTSIAALRHTTSILHILGINILTNHAQMQQRAHMKAVDRFRGSENSILVGTDGFARGMDFDDV